MALDPRRIPIIGNDIYQVGQVYNLLAQPCDPEPWVMVQATFTYAPTLVWSLLKPDPLDLAFDRAGRRHRRVGRRRMNVSALNQLELQRPGTAGWFAFRAAEIGQRVGWYLLVADATTDFLINWTSMVYEWSGCTEPTNGRAYSGGGEVFVGLAVGTEDRALGFVNQEAQAPGNATSTLLAINATGPKTFAVSVQLRLDPYLGETGSIQRVYVRRNIDGIGITDFDLEPTVDREGRMTFTSPDIRPDVNTPATTWQVRCVYNLGYLYVTGGFMSAQGAAPGGLLPDP